jgi:hypothetical protein
MRAALEATYSNEDAMSYRATQRDTERRSDRSRLANHVCSNYTSSNGHSSHRGTGAAAGIAVRIGRGSAAGGKQPLAAALEQGSFRLAGWRRKYGHLGGEPGPVRACGGGRGVQSFHFRAGDAAYFPPLTRGIWTIHETLRKTYCIWR